MGASPTVTTKRVLVRFRAPLNKSHPPMSMLVSHYAARLVKRAIYPAHRLTVIAYEDIGLANQMRRSAVTALQAAERISFPSPHPHRQHRHRCLFRLSPTRPTSPWTSLI